MNNFNISRLNTALGIFRISGVSDSESLASSKIEITKVEVTKFEIMGTDGWVLLNRSSENINGIINELMPSIKTHLQAKSSLA